MYGILITGANGFVGRELIASLIRRTDVSVTAAVRSKSNDLQTSVNQVDGLWVGSDTVWREALRGVKCVVHLAGVTRETEQDRLTGSTYWNVNVEGTLNLARQAAAAGVERFIFISSVKVNGESTEARHPFTHDQKANPQDAYAVSKYRAEQGLSLVARETGLAVVIIRPPLVYGPGVKGNFRSMMAWIRKGIPLPLGAIQNQRSLVSLANLIDLILICLDHPAAANEIFLVSDGADLSTPELLRRLGKALGRPARLLPVPAWLLQDGAALLRKKSMAQRLCGNLQVDISHTCRTLNWAPRITVDEALKETANAYLTSVQGGGKDQKLLRLLDVAFSLVGLTLGLPVFLILLAVGYLDTRSPLFFQVRVGRHQKPFTLVKFRTMRRGTASVATHLADASTVTFWGRGLRRTKLDELPQLWNVLKGDMSLVGPRPGLFNQEELLRARAARDVFEVRPGITGLAQINGVDMSMPERLAEMDSEMIRGMSVQTYFRYIFLTLVGRGSGDRVRR